MRILGAAMGLLLLGWASGARAERLAGGVYGEMLVGFDPASQAVSGYFYSQTGQGQYSCIFYLRGRLRGAEAEIATYFPESPRDDLIKGRLVLAARGQFRVRLASEHGGCWNVRHFADEGQPAEFRLDAAHPWVSVAVVKADRAYFFDAPASPVHRKAHVVKGDGVGVRAFRPGWLQVDFVSGDRPVSGWIRESDVYPAGSVP